MDHHTNLPRLPACQSCYTKKAKVTAPGKRVTVESPADGKDIYELEQSVKGLQCDIEHAESLEDNWRDSPPQTTTEEPTSAPHEQRNEIYEDAEPVANREDVSPNITEGAGISFMSQLFSDSRWREQNQTLLHNLSKRSTIPETGIQPNPLPSAEEALVVFNSYLTASHVQCPFLLRRSVEGLYSSVYSSAAEHPVPQELPSHDLLRTYMILAIGAVRLYRAGTHQNHPYGYFLSALKHLDTNLLSRGLDSIQDLLLVSRFGIYYHIGTSIWEIIRLCTRMCIEQGLHRRHRSTGLASGELLEGQLKRRVFWQCYVMDRYSSVMLDRPPAIADRDIEVGFPVDANDDEVDTAETSGTFSDLDSFGSVVETQYDPTRTTEVSVFLLCLRLRKVTSQIHTRFRHKGPPVTGSPPGQAESVTASGQIYQDLDELLAELEEWRRITPVFENPKCLYETQEWYDLLLMRERLLLVRRAIDLVPKREHIPPRDLLRLCLRYAVGTVMTFCPLYEQGKVTFTRSYFQTLFTAGLSVMFCMSVLSNLESQAITNATEAVENGKRTLKRMARELPDAVHFVAIYEALQTEILGKLRHFQREDIFPNNMQVDHSLLAGISDVERGIVAPYSPQLYGKDYNFPEIQANLDSNSHWPLAGPGGSQAEPLSMNNDEPSADGSILPFDLFGDPVFWSMEAGMLGEYVYGDINAASILDDPS